MKQFSFNVLFVVATLCFTACEKVIDIELNEAEKQYVIEATVSNVNGEPAVVRISKTKAFSDNNDFNGVSGAVVTIQVNNTIVYTLSESTTGIYQTNGFKGMPGFTYKLKVVVNGNEFTAECKMPNQIVILDNILIDDITFPGSNSKVLVPSYQDPVGKGNSYRFIKLINNKLDQQVYVFNDDFTDGLRSSRPLFNTDDDADLKSGDIATVQMLCIDPSVYTYWYSLDQAATGNSVATPANPVTNIKGGALGYFSAHSVSIKTIQIP